MTLDQAIEEEHIVKWFRFVHLPAKLQAISMVFANVACELVDNLPKCAERTTALRKLLESKDCAVRAALEA